MNLIRNIGVTGLVKILSKVSALVRDRMVAHVLGAGPLADVFFVAFNAVNGLRNVISEEPVRASFLPLFAEYRELRSETDCWRMVNTVLNTLLVILLLVVIVVMAGGSRLVPFLAPGISDPGQTGSLTVLLRIMVPSVLFAGAAVLFFSMLTTMGQFAVPASLPFVLNVCIIGATALMFRHLGVYALAIGVLAGSLAQFGVQVPFLYRQGYRYAPVMDWRHPVLARMFRLMIPVILAQGLVQFIIIIDTGFASTLGGGSVSHLYYGNRIMLFPFDVIGLTISMVAFPVFARDAAVRNQRDLVESFSLAFRLLLVAGIPATAGVIVLARPVVAAVFGGALFDASAVHGAASALIWYMAGMVAFAGSRIIYPVFYAQGDTRTPLLLSAVCLVLNIIFDLVFIRWWGMIGIPLASSLVAVVNLCILLVLVNRRLPEVRWRKIGVSLFQSLLGTAGMTIGVTTVFGMTPHRWGVYAGLGLSITAGVLLYTVCMKLVKNSEVDQFLRMVLKK